MKRKLFAVLVVVIFVLLFLWGISKAQTKYVPIPSSIYEHIEVIDGKILSVDRYIHPSGRQISQGIHIHVVTKDGTVENISLGPSIYVDKSITLKEGDIVKVSVFRVTYNGQKYSMGKDITKIGEGKTLKLRDDKGYPMWSGSRYRK